MDIKTFIAAPAREFEGTLMVEFMSTFEASLDPALWITLIEEEHAEVIEALDAYLADKTTENKAALLKEIADLRYVLVGMNAVLVPHFEALVSPDSDLGQRIMATDKAITELAGRTDIPFDYETMQKAFYRVHVSNMSKLGEDGRPIRREDGKVLKGPNYEEAKLEDLVA
jgi:predicted HAD superfamily Cof-like phosphohydrolase